MSFVATNTPSEEDDIGNEAFFPAISPADFRIAVRQDKTVTPEKLRAAMTEAILAANRELADWRAEKTANGYATLASIPQPEIGGIGALLHHYRRAVYSLTKAELLERYRDFDATRSGAERDQENPAADDIYRRDARWALADLMGRHRTVVELI